MNNQLKTTIEQIEKQAKERIEQAKKLASEGKLLKLEIQIDEYPESPREWGNIGKIAVKCRNYDLSDKDAVNSKDCEDLEELRQKILEEVGDCVILPVYLFDHSGIRISTSSFNCRFDSGQIGFIYCKKGFEDMTDKEIETKLEGEVKFYDLYLGGEVYAYRIANAVTGDFLEICGGFYNFEEAQGAGEEELARLTTEHQHDCDMASGAQHFQD